MKFFTLAALLSLVSADAIHDTINGLRIDRFNQLENMISQDAEPVQKLEHALKSWAHSMNLNEVNAVDAEFIQSDVGQKMTQKWMEVGKILEEKAGQQGILEEEK